MAARAKRESDGSNDRPVVSTFEEQRVYLCPTDKLALGKIQRPTGLLRDSSYAMNCSICHNTDPARYVAPSRTMLFMEDNLNPYDFSGVVGPHAQMGVTNRSIWLRHNNRAASFGFSKLCIIFRAFSTFVHCCGQECPRSNPLLQQAPAAS